jgi:hypothetical protein
MHVCEGQNFGIESKSKRGFEKVDMHVVIIVESTTIVSPITIFESKLVPMFFHMNLIIKFIIFFQNWRFVTIVVLIVGVKGGGNSKGEK